MKTVTIVRIDNTVVIDGVGTIVDCSIVDSKIHAIQWNETTGRGVIEFVDEDPYDGQKPINEFIDSIAPYRSLVDAAKEALAAAAAKRAALEADAKKA